MDKEGPFCGRVESDHVVASRGPALTNDAVLHALALAPKAPAIGGVKVTPADGLYGYLRQQETFGALTEARMPMTDDFLSLRRRSYVGPVRSTWSYNGRTGN